MTSIHLFSADVRDAMSYPPLDVPGEELTLSDVHSVPGHSQPQLLGIGESINGEAVLTCCDTHKHINPVDQWRLGSVQKVQDRISVIMLSALTPD